MDRMSASLLAVVGVALAIGGTIVSAVDARWPIGARDLSFVAAVAGLLMLAIVVVKTGDEAVPARFRARYGRWAPWVAPALAIAVMTTMLVSRYGFRSCADLAAERQCPCYYVAWQYSTRNGQPADVQAARRADVRAMCPADDLPPELKQ